VDKGTLDALLVKGVHLGATDIHFKAGDPPVYRISGKLRQVKEEGRLVPADTEAICACLLDADVGTERLRTVQEQDSSYSLQGIGRFRVNVYRQRGSLSCVLHVIPAEVPTIDGMGLPQTVKALAQHKQGIVLVTGATGSGKSTTLAAMVDHINRTDAVHVLTIEDPIEYLHRNIKASVSQREVGPDTHAFKTALRAALWQDPDVVLVGEMQDSETIDVALRAAETGHMVFSVVQAADAVRAIDHVLGLFEERERDRTRQRLADALCGMVSQRLVRCADGKGRVAVCEILVASAEVQECIREGRDADLKEIMGRSRSLYGMQTFEQHLEQLREQGIVPTSAASAPVLNPGGGADSSHATDVSGEEAVRTITDSETFFRGGGLS